MFEGPHKLVIGYRWETNGGQNACARCAELNGQEFYYRPKPGQRSVGELPDTPLHPNCRCIHKPLEGHGKVIDQAAAEAAKRAASGSAARRPAGPDGLLPPVLTTNDADEDCIVLGGVVLGYGGRSWLDGPTYGYYGGKNWQRGQNVTGMTPDEITQEFREIPPVDDLDRIFKRHDEAYNACRSRYGCEREADQNLVDAMEELMNNPGRIAEILKGRSPEEKEYAITFLKWAHWWFKGVVTLNQGSVKGEEH